MHGGRDKVRTPIADFVKEYADKKYSRFHMPGHKGQAFLGCEAWDITEIAGADALYEAEGIIAESEKNAAALFGTARTLFSAEGSSQCIRAMLYLAVRYGAQTKRNTGKPYVIAARNVHKAFLYAAALIDFEVVWLYPQEMHSLCSCVISPEQLETEIGRQKNLRGGAVPAAVYVTSPDYLGGQSDIAGLAECCHKQGTILAVDNAHGAYLHFLKKPQHPIDLGADICCDSAHKTLPVLTGGAYLQISKKAPAGLREYAKQAMALFGSTSPSYLTLASLDLCNGYLTENYSGRLSDTIQKLERIRLKLRSMGWQIEQTDPLKITLRMPKGMSGMELAAKLREVQMECEYADASYLVLMAAPENSEADYMRLLAAMEKISASFTEKDIENMQEKRCLQPVRCEAGLSIREAVFAEQEFVQAEASLGRICGMPTVGCPPAIPIAVAGEVIKESAVRLFAYYGIEKVSVVKLREDRSLWEE